MLLTTGVSAKIFDFKKLGIDLLGKDDYDKDINLNKDISLDKDIKNSKLAKNEYKELEEEDKAKKSAKEKAKAEAEKNVRIVFYLPNNKMLLYFMYIKLFYNLIVPSKNQTFQTLTSPYYRGFKYFLIK